MPLGDLAREDDYRDELVQSPYWRTQGGRMGLSPEAAGVALRKSADVVAFPGRYMEGVAPQAPGELTEEDVFRQDARERAATDWGRKLGFSTVFDPLPAAVTLASGGSLRGSMGSVGAGAGQGIKAYHSSPHDFEKFDLGKIGTGEGAQVYGHGIYAAENPAVSGQGGQYWTQFSKRFAGPEELAMHSFKNAQFDRDAAVQKLGADIAATKAEIEAGMFSNGQRMSPEYITDQVYYISKQRQALKLLESGKPVGPRTYEVNIKARPEEFLDWDKRLHEQPQAVRETLQQRVPDLAEAFPGSQFYARAAAAVGGRPQASQALREAGIPGIRYLDEGSRAPPDPERLAGLKFMIDKDSRLLSNEYLTASQRSDIQGRIAANAALVKRAENPTSNYVIFDPERIAILRKYGIPVTAGGMGSLAAQDNYQQ